MTINCTVCGADCTHYHLMCDEVPEGEWCPTCFEKTPCGKGEHGEGCPTVVINDDKVRSPGA